MSPARQLLREQASLSLVRASRLPPSTLHHQGWLFHPTAGPQAGPPSPRPDHLSSLVQHPASTRPPLPPPPCSPVESFKLQTHHPLPCLKLFMAPWCPGIKPKLLTRPKPTTRFPTPASLFQCPVLSPLLLPLEFLEGRTQRCWLTCPQSLAQKSPSPGSLPGCTP